MADTPTKPPRRSSKAKPKRSSGATLTVLLDARTLDELRAHWHKGNVEPSTLRAVGEAVYGANWRVELAVDLAAFRPAGGGRPSSGKLSHSLLGKWLTGRADIPAWVTPALLELPRLYLARRRKAVADELAALQERLDEAQRAWVRERVPRHRPAPPTLEPPLSTQSLTVDELIAASRVSQEELEAAHDAGWHDYGVAAGESDDEPLGCPAAPALSARWERGWREANAEHQKRHADWVARAGQLLK